MGASAIAAGVGGGVAGAGGAAFSRDRCARGDAAGRAILGITISHFASAAEAIGPAGFKACGFRAWFGFVATTSMVAATDSTSLGAGGGSTFTGIGAGTGIGICRADFGDGLAGVGSAVT